MSGKSIPILAAGRPTDSRNKFMAVYLGKNREGKKCYGIIALSESEDAPARLLTKGSDLPAAIFDARAANAAHSAESQPPTEIDDALVMPEFLEAMRLPEPLTRLAA